MLTWLDCINPGPWRWEKRREAREHAKKCDMMPNCATCYFTMSCERATGCSAVTFTQCIGFLQKGCKEGPHLREICRREKGGLIFPAAIHLSFPIGQDSYRGIHITLHLQCIIGFFTGCSGSQVPHSQGGIHWSPWKTTVTQSRQDY